MAWRDTNTLCDERVIPLGTINDYPQSPLLIRQQLEEYEGLGTGMSFHLQDPSLTHPMHLCIYTLSCLGSTLWAGAMVSIKYLEHRFSPKAHDTVPYETR